MSASTATAPDPGGLGDEAFLQDLRRQMVRFATLQLSDGPAAEDAVQEALLGALRNSRSFAGRAAFKTWVFAILRHKITDTLRQRLRMREAGLVKPLSDEDEDLGELFDARGFWEVEERPVRWGDPHEALRQAEFWRMFELCLEALPGQQARVFMMREFIELDSHEVCATVGITTGNLNVMLYRARLRLRECLENRWFADGRSA